MSMLSHNVTWPCCSTAEDSNFVKHKQKEGIAWDITAVKSPAIDQYINARPRRCSWNHCQQGPLSPPGPRLILPRYTETRNPQRTRSRCLILALKATRLYRRRLREIARFTASDYLLVSAVRVQHTTCWLSISAPPLTATDLKYPGLFVDMTQARVEHIILQPGTTSGIVGTEAGQSLSIRLSRARSWACHVIRGCRHYRRHRSLTFPPTVLGKGFGGSGVGVGMLRVGEGGRAELGITRAGRWERGMRYHTRCQIKKSRCDASL
ncbi:hypothetical protein VTK26DRAFT_7985 [Humicola hyalothermophila]